MIKIIKNVLTLENSFNLYQDLINRNMWMLTKASSKDKPAGNFPGVTFIEENKVVYDDAYLIGYFNCLFDTINQKLEEQHNFNLNKNIKRISLNAQNNNHYTEFHMDALANSKSIVGFLTPQWAENWGGELNIEGQIFKYSPRDFILFDSNQLHKSQAIKQIPYWRISINYIIEK